MYTLLYKYYSDISLIMKLTTPEIGDISKVDLGIHIAQWNF